MRRYVVYSALGVLLIFSCLFPNAGTKTVEAVQHIEPNTLDLFTPAESIIKLPEDSAQQGYYLWSVSGIAYEFVDQAGKTRVLVDIINGSRKEQVMLKYSVRPSNAVILADAAKRVTMMNNPEPLPLTADQLQIAVNGKDVAYKLLDATIGNAVVLLDSAGKSLPELTQTLAALRATLGNAQKEAATLSSEADKSLIRITQTP